MKQALLIATAALALSVTACNRHQASVDPGANSVKTYTTNSGPGVAHIAGGRLVSQGYSKSIAIDSANKMIGSYVSSVGYPYYDTAVRVLMFDADTIKKYLQQNNNVSTLAFYIGHQLGWLNASTGNYGKNIGLQPGKITVICVGLDDDGAVVRNSSNGVYEHAMPCPSNCPPAASSPLLQ